MLTRSCPTTDLIHKDLKGPFPWRPSITAALLCYYTELNRRHIRRERKIAALHQGDEVSMERMRRARC